MKRIILDFSTYEGELENANRKGYTEGLQKVAEYLESGKTWQEFNNFELYHPSILSCLWERIEKVVVKLEVK